MPRPSLKDQRTQQILDAFVTCVARYGLEGATLERISTEAGVRRSLLRHYLGNRDDMIAALQAHTIEAFDEMSRRFEAVLAESHDASQILECLFDSEYQTDPRLILVYQSLVASIATHPERRAPLLGSMETLLVVLQEHLTRCAPDVPSHDIQTIAHGITLLFVATDALSPLTPPSMWHHHAKQAATLLLARISQQPHEES